MPKAYCIWVNGDNCYSSSLVASVTNIIFIVLRNGKLIKFIVFVLIYFACPSINDNLTKIKEGVNDNISMIRVYVIT